VPCLLADSMPEEGLEPRHADYDSHEETRRSPCKSHVQGFLFLWMRTNVQTIAQLLHDERRCGAVCCCRLPPVLVLRLGSSVARGAELAQGDHQRAWGGGQRANAESPVESGACSSLACTTTARTATSAEATWTRESASRSRVAPKSLALALAVDGEPSEQGDRNRKMGRLALAHRNDGALMPEVAGDQGVVAPASCQPSA
jgi:hypothetical protein